MGCSATKNMTVEPLDDNKAMSNGNASNKSTNVPKMGTLDSDYHTVELVDASVNNVQKAQNGMSFEITFDEEKDESIIQKHPPKRLQKLEEEQTNPQLTLDKLQEKLDEAEMRRQQVFERVLALSE